MSKLIRALERAGLVERVENPDDTRAVQLNVTARGIEASGASHPWAAAGANGVWS